MNIPMPRLLADVINSYGTLPIFESSTLCVPTPAPVVDGAAPIAINAAHQLQFASFVTALAHRNFISLHTITNVISGSGAFAISALSENLGRDFPAALPVAAIATINTDQMYIRSCHSNFNPSDVLLASVMVNGYTTHLEPGSRSYPWTSDLIPNVIAMRTSLFSTY